MARTISRRSRIRDRPVPWRLRLGLFSLLPATALVQACARRFPGAVEHGYSRTVYPVVREILGGLTGWFTWSLAELALVACVVFVAWRSVRGLGHLLRRRRSFGNLAAHSFTLALAAAGVLYAGAVFAWGLNYQRLPLAESVRLDVSPADDHELARLSRRLAERAAALRRLLPEDDAGVMRPLDSPRRALRRAPAAFARTGTGYPLLEGASLSRAKAIALPVLPWLDAGGVFSVYTSEPNVDMRQPAHDVLASACHEIAHQLGWAREEEAGFVGHVACRDHPDPDFRYATTLDALRHALRALGRADPDSAGDLRDRIDAGIRRDWQASRDFWRRYRTPLADLSEKTYDGYLKSQGQEAGVDSYGMVVDLLIGDLRRREAVAAESSP